MIKRKYIFFILIFSIIANVWSETGLSANATEVITENNTSKREYEIEEGSDNPMNSSNSHSVRQTMARAFALDLDVKVTSTFKKGPFDILLVLDFSGSMADAMDGTELTYSGVSSWDDPDYVAKNHEQSRYRVMRDAVEQFLVKLEATAAEDTNIGIITYNRTVEVREFKALSETSSEDLITWMDSKSVGGATLADEALSQAQEMFAALPAQEHEGQRNIVFFTDGEPGTTGFDLYKDENGNFILPEKSAVNYQANSFRVMAETMNQAEVLKGNYGEVTAANNYVTAVAPQIVNPWMGGAIEDQYSYYGISVSPIALGLGNNWPDRDDVSEQYALAAQSGRLDELWKVRSSRDTLNLLNRDLQSEDGKDYSALNYASATHGNYTRTASGQGVKIHSVGLFNAANYGEKIEYIKNYLNKVSSEGRYTISSEIDELLEAFEEIFEEIVGEFKGYISFELGDEFMAYSASGKAITNDRNETVWIEDSTVWVGPLDVISEAELMEIMLISMDNSLEPFVYEMEEGQEDVPDMVKRFKFHYLDNEENPDEDFVYIKSLEITERK